MRKYLIDLVGFIVILGIFLGGQAATSFNEETQIITVTSTDRVFGVKGSKWIVLGTDENGNPTDTIITWNIIPNMKKWSRTGTLLIADRVLLSYVSWDDLAAAGFVDGVEVVLKGRKYSCHMLPVGEKFNSQNAWDDALDRTRDDNEIWHWEFMRFWGRDKMNGLRTLRGHYSARHYDWNASSYQDATDEPLASFDSEMAALLNDLKADSDCPLNAEQLGYVN